MYTGTKTVCVITPNLSSLLKLEPHKLSEAMMVLHSLRMHELYIQLRSGQLYLGTPRDRAAKVSSQKNPFDKDASKRGLLPPILSLLLMELSRTGITIESDGIYMLIAGTGTKVKIAKYGHTRVRGDGEVLEDFRKISFEDILNSFSGTFEFDISVSHKDIAEDFEKLSELQSLVHKIHHLGSGYSTILGDKWIMAVDWDKFEDEQWYLEQTRRLTSSLATYNFYGLDVKELRNERNAFFTGHRIMELINDFKVVGKDSLMEPLHLIRAYVRETGY